MAAKSKMQKVLDLAGEFVIAQKGSWGHAEWEGFLAKVAALDIEITDESKRSLGNILESCKCFYCDGDVAPAKKAAPKPKVKAKAK